jgi:hypothetical protein
MSKVSLTFRFENEFYISCCFSLLTIRLAIRNYERYFFKDQKTTVSEQKCVAQERGREAGGRKRAECAT